MPPPMPWWQTSVLYQIYPRSFLDTDGDGVGDLEGVRAKLPYLRWLGVDGMWLSPIYRSPMADFGYDVSDHCAVDPLFGDLAGFDRVLGEAHGLGLRVLLDWVPNHTSDRHPWFLESRSGRASPKRDWYFWRDGRDGGPPNNWRAAFGVGHGRATTTPGSGTCTCSSPSSPTSTGAVRAWSTPCMASYGSGSTGGSTGSGPTSSISSARTRRCPTSPRSWPRSTWSGCTTTPPPIPSYGGSGGCSTPIPTTGSWSAR